MKNFPRGKYNVIYADPPWSYRNKRTGGAMSSGSGDKYEVMDHRDICLMPIYLICQEDAVLFLWTTVPLMDQGFNVMRAWGFKYKGSFFWEKLGRIGMGFWFRNNVEVLLYGVRGKVTPFRKPMRNLISLRPLKHSEKPEEFRKVIMEATDRVFDTPKRVELFATKKTKGWRSWGNAIEG